MYVSSEGSSSAWSKPRPRNTFCKVKGVLEQRGGEWLGCGSVGPSRREMGQGRQQPEAGVTFRRCISLSFPYHFSPIGLRPRDEMGSSLLLPIPTTPIPREKASLQTTNQCQSRREETKTKQT